MLSSTLLFLSGLVIGALIVALRVDTQRMYGVKTTIAWSRVLPIFGACVVTTMVAYIIR